MSVAIQADLEAGGHTHLGLGGAWVSRLPGTPKATSQLLLQYPAGQKSGHCWQRYRLYYM